MVLAAKALTDSSKEPPSNSVEIPDTFIHNSPWSSPRTEARENALQSAEAHEFLFHVIRWDPGARGFTDDVKLLQLFCGFLAAGAAAKPGRASFNKFRLALI